MKVKYQAVTPLVISSHSQLDLPLNCDVKVFFMYVENKHGKLTPRDTQCTSCYVFALHNLSQCNRQRRNLYNQSSAVTCCHLTAFSFFPSFSFLFLFCFWALPLSLSLSHSLSLTHTHIHVCIHIFTHTEYYNLSIMTILLS